MAVGMFGRDAELDAIRGALERRPDALNVVVVEGVAGIGKTSLLRQVFEQHSAGIALAARPVESEHRLTFAALGDLLDGVPAEALAGLPEPQQVALDAALLRGAEGHVPGVRAVGTALRAVLARLAQEGTLLVVVDDLQWADEPSVAALAFAVRRLDERSVRLLVAERVPDGATPIDPLGLDSNLVERPVHVRVGPLSLAAIFHVVREHTGVALPRPLLVRITDESGGNPLYAIELARALAESGSRVSPGDQLPVSGTLEGLIESRLERAPGAWTATLLALALSRDLPLDDLERAVPGATEIVDQAHTARLIEWRDNRLRFAHPLFAAGVVRRASPAGRRAMHERLAAISRDPERRARHLALAATGPDEAIAASLTEAAEAAARRGAWAQAAELAGLAERATPGPETADAHRRALSRAGYLSRAGDAHGAGEALADLLPRVGDELRAQVLELQARVAFDSTVGGATLLRLCDDALALAGDSALQARIYATRGAIGSYVDLDRASADAERALALLAEEPQPDPAVYVTAVMVLAGCRFERGEALPSELIERTLAIEREHPNPDVGDRLGPALGSFLKYSGRLADARELLLEGYRAAVDEGDDGSLPYAVSHLPQVELWAGRPSDAERWAAEHLALAEHTGQLGQRISALYNLAQIHTHRGRFSEAEAELDTADELIGKEVDGDWAVGPLAGARGYLHLLRGELEPAVAELRRSSSVFADVGAQRPRRGDRDLAEALVRAGQLDEARAVIDRLERSSALVGHHDLLGGARVCRALLAAAEQRLDDASTLIAEAVRELEQGEEPLAMGRALLALGQIRRRRGERRLAVEAFDRAEQIFTEIEARPWAVQAAEARSRVPVRQRQGPGLTDGEQRVAQAAARGLTNQEIAAELFVSVKTVEANLTRAYAKLNVRSRAELSARMAGGPVSPTNS